MSRGKVVLIKCWFTRGGFPSELVFHIAAQGGGELAGVAPRGYCFDGGKKPLKVQLKRDEKVEGYVVGLLLKMGEATSHVNLPDNDVYDIPNAAIMRNGELVSVPLRS